VSERCYKVTVTPPSQGRIVSGWSTTSKACVKAVEEDLKAHRRDYPRQVRSVSVCKQGGSLGKAAGGKEKSLHVTATEEKWLVDRGWFAQRTVSHSRAFI
jgi:hypothetical protein